MKEIVFITDFSMDGFGIGRTTGGRVLKTPFTCPGDIVRLEFEPKSGSMPKGDLIEVMESSPHRLQHPCTHYSEGCPCSPLGIYDYSAALEWKRKNLQETLRRVGGIEIETPTVVASSSIWGYRDRIELTLDYNGKKINAGYLGSKGHIPIRDCLLGDNSIREALRTFVEKISAHDWKRESQSAINGCVAIGRIMFRSNRFGGVVGVLYLNSEYRAFSKQLAHILGKSGLTAWQIKFCDAYPNIRTFTRIVEMEGNPDIMIHAAGVTSPAKPGIFSQVNSEIAGFISGEVAEYCRSYTKVLDLFGGYGVFGLAAATNGAEVMVVDVDRDSLAAGSILAGNAGLNVKYYHWSLEKAESWGRLPLEFDAVILDPPHKGIHQRGIEWLNGKGPPVLIYVSCHPAVLARDIKRLESYQLDEIKLYDMFPQTPELETLAVLKRLA